MTTSQLTKKLKNQGINILLILKLSVRNHKPSRRVSPSIKVFLRAFCNVAQLLLQAHNTKLIL